MRRSTGRRLWVGVCGILLTAAVLSGCAKNNSVPKDTAARAVTGGATQAAAKTEDKAGEQTIVSAACSEKEIQHIVTAAAGGGTDTMARAVCVPLEKALGKAIVIINNGSASGLVGMGNISRAAANGYTLGVFSNMDVANFVYGASECDFTTDDSTHIAGLNTTRDVLILKKGSNMKNLDDFVSKAKKKLGELTIALPSTIQDLSLDLMNGKIGIVTADVVYEGGNKVLAGLLGGHIEAGILSTKFIPWAREQDLIVLGIILGNRLGAFPDISTFLRQGYDIVNPAVRMLVGPKGPPESVVNVLVENLKQGYEDEIKESVPNIDEEPALLTGADPDAFLKGGFAMREAILKK